MVSAAGVSVNAGDEVLCPSSKLDNSTSVFSWNWLTVCSDVGLLVDVFCLNCFSSMEHIQASDQFMLAPCSSSESTATRSCSSADYLASPRIPDAVISEYEMLNKNGVIRMLMVTFEDRQSPPRVLAMSSTPSSRSIRVMVSLDGDGLVYCQATLPSAGPPSSVAQIIAASNSGWSSGNMSVITIPRLEAASAYVVYCLTSSLDGGGTTPLPTVLNR